MRLGLLKSIRDSKDVTNAVILTHNIHFIFLQTVVLAELRRCGHPRLTIFSDAQCALSSYSQQAPLLDALGSRFRVVPVAMEPGFRFHPKALLLSGKDKASLFVGSGNLTYGGWRENGEVWTRYDTEVDGLSPFVAFREYLNSITAATPLRGAIESEIDEAFDAETRLWVAASAGPKGLLGRMRGGDDLITQMKKVMGDKQVKRLTICAPYFDEKGLALRRLVQTINPKETVVLAQRGRCNLPKSTADKLPQGITISAVDFVRQNPDESERSSLMHAKFYALEWDDKVTVFSGSANCSQAALTISGTMGNAELLTYEEMSPQVFRESFLGEITLLTGDPQLSDAQEEQIDMERLPDLHVLAARHSGAVLRVAFRGPANCLIKKCLVDGEAREFITSSQNILDVEIPAAPRTVQLEAHIEGAPVISNVMWVDDEHALLSSAWTRSVDHEIRDRVREGNWDISAWTRIMEVFCKHLQYMPRSYRATLKVASAARPGPQMSTFNAADIYAEGYGLPSLDLMSLALGTTNRTNSLQQTLLRWFGLPIAEVPEGQRDPEEEDGPDTSAGTGEEQVDRPERLRAVKKTVKRKEPTAGDRKRATLIIEQVRTALTSNEYLAARTATALAADIKIASALFQTALREDWITAEAYCEASSAIWTSLFISRGDEKAVGWIEYRYQEAEDTAAFAEALSSLQLTVALATWALAVPLRKESPAHSLFALASAYSVARLPWLWKVDQTQAIATEMAQLMRDTGALTAENHESWEQASSGWKALIQRGAALHDFERAALGFTAMQLAGSIKQTSIRAGELLWQGVSGFVVAVEMGARPAGNSISGRHFATNKTKKYAAQFVLPISGLLECDLITLPRAARKILQDFIADLS